MGAPGGQIAFPILTVFGPFWGFSAPFPALDGQWRLKFGLSILSFCEESIASHEKAT